MRALACVVVMLASAAAHPLLAQSREPAPRVIPAVLVDAMFASIGWPSAPDSRFSVGRVPDGWPAALIPRAPAKVIGGSTFQGQRDIVVSYPRSAPAESLYTTLLSRAGFTMADSSRLDAPAGFASGSIIFGGALRGHAWCGADDRTAVVLPFDSTSTTRLLHVILFVGERGPVSACGKAPERDAGRMMSNIALRVPVLLAPRGAYVASTGMHAGGSSFDLQAQADTALSALALTTHYGKELERGGWKLIGAPASSGGSAMRAVAARDVRGAAWQGAVVVLTVGDHRELHVMMGQVNP
jgi:hypothetical protein